MALEEANLYALVVALLNLLLSGFFVSKDNIPAAYRWMSDLQIMSHSVAAAVKTEFTGLTLSCSAEELVNGVCPTPTGEAYLAKLSMAEKAREEPPP